MRISDWSSDVCSADLPERQRIEIQIRTREMHEVSEYGVAAHWKYKHGAQVDGRQYRWLRELLDILETAAGPEDFLERSDERRVGKEGDSTCRSRRAPYH